MLGRDFLKRYISVIIVLVLMCGISVQSVTLKFGTDSTGQTWFGEDGGNLVTNTNGKAWDASSNVAIQKAVNDLNNNSGTVFVPNGTVQIQNTIEWYTGLHIVGQGKRSTIIDASLVSGYAFEPSSATTSAIRDVVLEGFTLDGGNKSGHGINYRDTWNAIFRDLKVQYFYTGTGLVIDGNSYGASGLRAYNCEFYNNSFGCQMINSGTSWCSINMFEGCAFTTNLNDGVDIDRLTGVIDNTVFDSCQFEGNGGWGIDVKTSVSTQFYNCWVEGNNLSDLTGNVHVSTSAWNVEFKGGAISDSSGQIKIDQISKEGFGVKFDGVNNQGFLSHINPSNYVITEHDFNGSKCFLINGTDGGIERVGTFQAIINQAVDNLPAKGGTITLKRISEGVFQSTDTIYLDQKDVTLDMNGCTIEPSTGNFDVINITRSGVVVKNGKIDVTGVTFANTSACIKIDGWLHNIHVHGNRTIIRDMELLGANGLGKGIHYYAGNLSHLASITFTLVDGVNIKNFSRGIHIENENGDDKGGAGSQIGGNTFTNIRGVNCGQFINISNRRGDPLDLDDDSSATGGNIFSNIEYQTGAETEDVIWCEGEKNMFYNFMVWDWKGQKIAGSDIYAVDLTDESEDTHLEIQGIKNWFISDEGTNNFYVTTGMGITGTTPESEIKTPAINASYYNANWTASLGARWYHQTTGNPYWYMYGSVSGTPKYGGMRIIDTFGDWQFITEHSGSDITLQPNSDVVNIEDCIRLTPRSSPPTGQDGRIYFDSDDNRLYLYNGSWTPI